MATEDPDLKSIRDDSLEPIDATHAHTDPTVTVSETQSFIPSANRVSEYKFDSSWKMKWQKQEPKISLNYQ